MGVSLQNHLIFSWETMLIGEGRASRPFAFYWPLRSSIPTKSPFSRNLSCLQCSCCAVSHASPWFLSLLWVSTSSRTHSLWHPSQGPSVTTFPRLTGLCLCQWIWQGCPVIATAASRGTAPARALGPSCLAFEMHAVRALATAIGRTTSTMLAVTWLARARALVCSAPRPKCLACKGRTSHSPCPSIRASINHEKHVPPTERPIQYSPVQCSLHRA